MNLEYINNKVNFITRNIAAHKYAVQEYLEEFLKDPYEECRPFLRSDGPGELGDVRAQVHE